MSRNRILLRFANHGRVGSAFALIAVAVLAPIPALAAGPSDPADPAPTTQYDVRPGLSPATIDSAFAKAGSRVVETQYRFTTGGHTLTVGIPGPGLVADDVTAVADTLADLAVSDRQTIVPAGSVNQMPGLLATATQAITSVLTPSMITVTGSGGLAGSNFAQHTAAPTAATSSIPSAAAACGSWTPVYNGSNSAASASGGRFNNLTFSWSTAALAALHCTGSSTWEPDFVTYNYDNKYYFSSSMLARSTSMPNGYWDTNAFDAPEERVYTVGSSNNAPFAANTVYAAYFRMSNGNFSSDTAKVVWQRGHYTFGCGAGPAWCIFADESNIRYAWLITIPGSWHP